MSFGGGGNGKGPSSEINVTPLIDIVLVMLIIFMVMTPVMLKEIGAAVPRKATDETVAPPGPPPTIVRLDAAGDLSFLRASVGRYGETTDLQRPDDELVAIAVAEVSEALGHQLPRIVDTHVQRWGGALPQYTVGHLDRVARIRADTATAPGLELAGAAYAGVGVPACIASGRSAAQAVATHLRARSAGTGG